MPRFANSILFGKAAPTPALLWLAGLLEGEGTFLRPPPSSPGQPIVSCRMTDRDVIDRVGAALGTSVSANDKGNYKTEYAAAVRGARAVALMTDIKPMLGTRRQAAIDRALAGYVPPRRKLNYEKAEEIRRRHGAGEGVSSLARSFGVARQTIHPILDHRIYKAHRPFPWRANSFRLGGITAGGTRLSWAELFWLAGFLEGEGCFSRPAPSAPNRPRILVQSCDEDVMAEVGRLMRIKPLPYTDPRGVERGWSPIWRVALVGRRAIGLMEAIHAVMGHRRQRQIDDALTAGAVRKMEASRIELESTIAKRTASTGLAGS